MGNSGQSVPIIDISPYFAGTPSERRALAKQVDEACRSIGFLTVAGHGVPETLICRTQAEFRQFFDLPESDKKKYSGTRSGYSALESKALNYSLGTTDSPPDYSETYSINHPGVAQWCSHDTTSEATVAQSPNLWPDLASFRETTVAYYRALEDLAQSIMRIFALALELPEDWFDAKLDRHISSCVARNYPDQPNGARPGQLRAGAHTDFGSLTILKTEDKPGGLEVQNRDGVWEAVPILPGTFVINIGDLLAHWTNDRWVSTMHRVVNPPRDLTTGTRRLSIAFFHQPNYDAVIETIPSCVDVTRPPRPAITSGAHLTAKATSIRQVSRK